MTLHYPVNLVENYFGATLRSKSLLLAMPNHTHSSFYSFVFPLGNKTHTLYIYYDHQLMIP